MRHRVPLEITLLPTEQPETYPVFPALCSYRAETDRFTALRLGGENPSRELPGFDFLGACFGFPGHSRPLFMIAFWRFELPGEE